MIIPRRRGCGAAETAIGAGATGTGSAWAVGSEAGPFTANDSPHREQRTRRETGSGSGIETTALQNGQVVDAAIVDGSANMMNLLMGLRSAGQFSSERGKSLLDGPHWYRTYRCKDGGFVTVGSAEPKFYRLLVKKLGLCGDPVHATQGNPNSWPMLHKAFAELFASRTRDEWPA